MKRELMGQMLFYHCCLRLNDDKTMEALNLNSEILFEVHDLEELEWLRKSLSRFILQCCDRC
jgi:hypothetical protein